MNDRFKFRVYYKGSDYAKAGYQDLTRKDVIYSLNTNGVLIRDCIYECQQEGHEGSPCHMPLAQNNDMYVVQFCTGLKDKNGVLIYEGDIVKENWHTYVIDHDRGYSINDIKTKCSYTISTLCNEKSEVIGNIYENPELLEVEK